jgi:hypothetical protein
MNELELKQRTKTFGLRVLKLVDALPRTTAGKAANELVAIMVASRKSTAR